jgi:hypothetical protein
MINRGVNAMNIKYILVMILRSAAFVAHASDSRPGVPEGKFADAIPESMKVVDALTGIKVTIALKVPSATIPLPPPMPNKFSMNWPQL